VFVFWQKPVGTIPRLMSGDYGLMIMGYGLKDLFVLSIMFRVFP